MDHQLYASILLGSELKAVPIIALLVVKRRLAIPTLKRLQVPNVDLHFSPGLCVLVIQNINPNLKINDYMFLAYCFKDSDFYILSYGRSDDNKPITCSLCFDLAFKHFAYISYFVRTILFYMKISNPVLLWICLFIFYLYVQVLFSLSMLK
jgi:hypothetical protein